MQLQLAQLRACCARVVCARRAEWFCPSSMVVNLCGNNNNNNNKHDNVYGAVIMAEPLREFTRFI